MPRVRHVTVIQLKLRDVLGLWSLTPYTKTGTALFLSMTLSCGSYTDARKQWRYSGDETYISTQRSALYSMRG